jgi:hypothetical protein
MTRFVSLVTAVIVSTGLFASQREPVYREDGFGIRKLTPPPAPLTLADPDVVLPEPRGVSSAEQRSVIGVVRPFVESSDERRAPTSFQSKGAVRVRLRLTGVSLPEGFVAWVHGSGGDAVPFGAELLFEGAIWTPSVAGDTIALTLPAEAHAEVSAIGHLAQSVAPEGTECIQDVSCNSFADRTTLSKAIAVYTFVDDGNHLIYACTGGLINGADGDRLFLTSRSCVSSGAEAASIEAAWDFKTAFCGGQASVGHLTNGAALLTSSAATDAALLRLHTLPPGRWLMGWDTRSLSAGETLYRISHPLLPDNSGVFAQAYSSTAVTTSSGTCPTWSRPNFLYATRNAGGVGPTSLGAPVITNGGYIVGQLIGICSYAGAPDGCASTSLVVDGALRVSYDTLKAYIDPPTPTVCTANATTVCLLNNRFRVNISYVNPFSNPPNQTGNFLAARLLQGAQNPDTGLFGFSSAQAVEVVVRVQDTRPFAQRFDVYYGGMTDVGYTVTVTDTQTGTTRQYANTVGKIGGGVDRNSFPAN